MKKSHLSFITLLLSGLSTSLAGMPKDMPEDKRKPFDELDKQVVLLKGRFSAITPEADAADDAAKDAMVKPFEDALRLTEGIIKHQETVILSLPEQIRLGIEAGINAKLTSGELVKKETATSLAATARADGEKAAKEAILLHGKRRQELVALGLPSIEDAAVLGMEQAAFDAAKAEAVKRDPILKGFHLPDTDRARLLFVKQEEFDNSKKTYETILAGAGVKPNPMLGGGGGNNNPGEKFAC